MAAPVHLRLYELTPDGARRYRRALLGLPKGNGKTPLAAAIAAYELCGGRHVSPIVIVAAASLKQADLVFGDLRTMCRESPVLAPITEPFDLEILLRDAPGRAQRVAAIRRGELDVSPETLEKIESLAKEAEELPTRMGSASAQRAANLLEQAHTAQRNAIPFNTGQVRTHNWRTLPNGGQRYTEIDASGKKRHFDYDPEEVELAKDEAGEARPWNNPQDVGIKDIASWSMGDRLKFRKEHPQEWDILKHRESRLLEQR